MANEISVICRISADKGFLSLSRDPGLQQITMTGTRYVAGVQDIGFAAHELLVSAAEFGTAGWSYFRNLDAVNFVEIGRDSAGTFVPFAKLTAGKGFVVPLSTDAVYAKADTAAVPLEFAMLEA